MSVFQGVKEKAPFRRGYAVELLHTLCSYPILIFIAFYGGGFSFCPNNNLSIPVSPKSRISAGSQLCLAIVELGRLELPSREMFEQKSNETNAKIVINKKAPHLLQG